jgi:hypothetical protein
MRDTAGTVDEKVRPGGRIVAGDVRRLAGRDVELRPSALRVVSLAARRVASESKLTNVGGALHPDPKVVEVGQLGHAGVQSLDQDDAPDRQLAQERGAALRRRADLVASRLVPAQWQQDLASKPPPVEARGNQVGR